ncbi:hypothetical protein PQG02_12750 [Nostoc sp. UHCC 0926]|uniref:hypothetical protein n=1 Tax=unclassified Nostoc TaxID=2593658 RepID=UPI002362A087|nr:hypothetical protein [Nostoc sp. UHCC 0926]WDD35127.1 hypothetical protein PQG02_12750 [Nostoc sp. UHCC 0926]
MSSFKIGHGGATALSRFPGLYSYGDLASKSVSRHLLYLGKPLGASLSLWEKTAVAPLLTLPEASACG